MKQKIDIMHILTKIFNVTGASQIDGWSYFSFFFISCVMPQTEEHI